MTAYVYSGPMYQFNNYTEDWKTEKPVFAENKDAARKKFEDRAKAQLGISKNTQFRLSTTHVREYITEENNNII